MFRSLGQLHPMPCKRDTLLVAAALGTVIALFLIIFEPFGLNTVPGGFRKTTILVGYGIITFAVVAVNGVLLPTLFPRFYDRTRWTLLKDMFFFGFLNFMTICVVNFLYSSCTFHFSLNWNRFLFSLFATFSVGFLPFVMLLLFRHNRLLRMNLRMAAEMNRHLPLHTPVAQVTVAAAQASSYITIASDTAYDSISFAVGDLLYAESADNYIKVCYMDKGTARTAVIRQTLKTLEDKLTGTTRVVRCHRSFIVNLDKIAAVSGNAQGLKLSLHGTDVVIPVSRTSVAGIKQLLNAPS
ncbi:LytTR family DNA-binding domain-containing protein [Nemorincola caseinilytica]|uniref:LytTR family DNA-binding domain-containing protein n=1 Tax=Nemorincola caseinilytica TaxID=2054315 RepID=A0ABP8NQ90_9BACT